MTEKNIFPELVRKLIEALDSEERQLIVSYIITRGRPVKASELQRALGFKKEELDRHLEKLVDGYVLRKIPSTGETDYILTSTAISFLEGIVLALLPKRK